MQEFRHELRDEEEQWFTQAATVEGLHAKMNIVQEQMEDEGYLEVKRVKVGRNDTCPCGSGKKFKKCHINKAL